MANSNRKGRQILAGSITRGVNFVEIRYTSLIGCHQALRGFLWHAHGRRPEPKHVAGRMVRLICEELHSRCIAIHIKVHSEAISDETLPPGREWLHSSDRQSMLERGNYARLIVSS